MAAPARPAGPEPGQAYRPPSSPAYASATKPPPPRGSASVSGATTTPPATPAAHLAGSGGPGGGGKSGRGGIVAAIVLVIALVGAAGAFFLLSGDDDKDDAAAPASTEHTDDTGADTTAPPATEDPGASLGEPVDVAQAFFAAAIAGDCPGMASLLTEGSLLIDSDTVEEGLADCERSVADGDTGFEGMTVGNVTLVSVEGDTAIVSVDFDISGQASTEQFHLQRVDGEWRMDLLASA
jgi:hypothetical protein